jgi:hypothetical protein
MRIGVKLTIAFFAIACVSALVIGMIAYYTGKSSLEEESFNRLTAVREMKASQIEDYFQQINDQALTFSEDPSIVNAMKELKAGFNTIDTDLGIGDGEMDGIDNSLKTYFETEYLKRLNRNLAKKATFAEESSEDKHARILQYHYVVTNPHPVGEKQKLDHASDKSRYSTAHSKVHPVIRNYLEKFGYYDIFLIDSETGNVVYTVFKEVDFGTSLLTGPFKYTNLADAFRIAKASSSKKPILVDYEPYHPSYNAHAAFIAAPIYDGEKKIGVLVFQLPIDRINDIMTNKQNWSGVGLGATGETYIVGEDYTLRNQSRFLIEDSTNYFRMINDIGPRKQLTG